MKTTFLLTAFCFLIFGGQAAEPKKDSERTRRATAFELLRTYAIHSQKTLEVAPEAINDQTQITLKFTLKTNGIVAVDLGAIESAITNQTSLRLEKIGKTRIKVSLPSQPTKHQATNDSRSGLVNWKNVPSDSALTTYAAVIGSTLIITPDAMSYSHPQHGINLHIEGSHSRFEIRDKMAEAITTQTPLRLTPLDETHIAVTFGDQPVPKLDAR